MKRTFRKSFSSVILKSRRASQSGLNLLRREALRINPIFQKLGENEEECSATLKKRDSFEQGLDIESDESREIRKDLYENMRLLISYKESKVRKPFIFAMDDEDHSSAEDKEENKLDYIQFYEKKYEEFNRENDNQDNLYTMKKEPFELLKYYGDPYACLDFRKKLLFVKFFISFISKKITSHPLFDYLMLLIILMNCIILAMEDTNSPDPTLLQIDTLLIIIYTIEMLLKMFANGLFINKGAYFRAGWNILDFMIVVTSYIPIIFSYQVRSFNLSSLRTLRVLRPLRTITSIKSLKVLMGTLFSSVPLLMDTITVLMLFFNIFSISGLQMFSGVLKNRCFIPETGFLILESGEEGLEELLCGYEHCPEEGVCGKIIGNPRWGVMNFDNYFYSFLMTFQCVNLQGWSVIMLSLIKTSTIYVAFYFILLIFIGAFFLLNLTLAVIKAKFTDNASKRLESVLDKNPQENEVDINELKNVKRLERTHYNRLKKRSVAPDPTFMKRISIKGNELIGNELSGLSQRIMEQKHKEKFFAAKRRINVKIPSKTFPLSELIMKRMRKNNRKMLKNLFKIKQRVPDNYEWVPGTITITPSLNPKSLKLIGMKHIYQEKQAIKKPNKLNINRGLMSLVHFKQKKWSFCDYAEDFLEEMKHEVPREFIDNRPEIALKSLKTTSTKTTRVKENTQENLSKTTQENLSKTPTLDLEEPLVKKELIEFTEDPDVLNIFNDAMFKQFYQESGGFMQSSIPKLRLMKNLNIVPETDGKNEEVFWLKSPEAAKETALAKYLKNPIKENDSNTLHLNPSNFAKRSLVYAKKTSMISPDKTSQMEYSPEKRGTLANLQGFFNLKKRNNLRDYKIMVDFNKPFRSISEADVLEGRTAKLLKRKKLIEMENFRKGKFMMIYHLSKKALKKVEKKCEVRIPKRKKNGLAFELKKQRNDTGKNLSSHPDEGFTTAVEKLMPNMSLYSQSPLKASAGCKSPRRKKLLKALTNQPSEQIAMTYDHIKRLLREKFTTESKAKMKENEELFFTILRKDIREQCKSVNNWSAEEVLQDGVGVYFGRFKSIARAMTSKNQDHQIWLPGLKGQLVLIHKSIRRFVCSKFVENLMLLFVIFNTIILSLDGLFTDSSVLSLFDKLNLFFTIAFAFEMLLKMVAFSISGYLRDKINLFDGTVVVISMAEVIFIEERNTMRTLATLKAFRVLRVMRLLRSLKFMNMIIEVLSKTLASFIYIAILLILFLFIYALLGMKLFGGEFNFKEKVYRQNFDSYNEAFLSVFQILSRSYWFYILDLSFRSQINYFISAFYLISWIFVGNFVFLNLFLAIMLDGFNQAQVENEENLTNDVLLEEDPEVIPATVEPSKLAKLKTVSSFDTLSKSEIEKLYGLNECETSFFLFSKTNFIRVICFRIVKSHLFEHFILLLIILNTVKMIVDTYIDPTVYTISRNFDEILTFAFLAESLIKSIALGFVLKKGSYLRDTWNVWDFIIVVTSLVDVFTVNFTIPVIKVFRILRTLRPLRFVSHNVNMKIVVNSLLDSVTSIINVFIVIFTVWLMFGILGISLLGGRMGYCDTTDKYGISKDQCSEMGLEWKTYETNFDNIYYAMNSLFIIGSLEGWPTIMYYSRDSNTSDIGPIMDNYSFISYYFVAFILIGAFFLMNLFIGVMFFHFNLAQKNEKSKKNLFLTEDQAKWLDIQKMIAKARPDFKFNRKPTTPLGKFIDMLISSKVYEYFMNLVYFLAILALTLTYDTSPVEYRRRLENLNFSVIMIILLDFILRVITYGIQNYFYTSASRLDLIIITCSCVDFLTIYSIIHVSSYIQSLSRITRVLFLLKLIKPIKGINNLIETLMFSLPSLLNVGALLILIYLMYSILGVYLFKNISHGVIVDEYNNFHNFHLAMLILFKCSTGDEWFHIMFDMAHKKDGCENDDSCGTPFAFLYFLSFFLICSYIMLNLFILIIIQQFEEYHLRDHNPIQTFRENLDTFKKIWSEFSKASEGLNISHRNLIEFYMKLPEPLGFGEGVPRTVIAKEIMNMNLSGDADGNIYFNELLFASMRRIFGLEVLKNAQSEIQTLLKREEYAIRKKIEKFRKKDIRKYSIISSRVSSKITSRNSSFFSSFFEKPIPEDFGFRKNIVNPIMEFFFVGMAFKSWKKFTILKIEKQLTNDDSFIVNEEEKSSEEEIKEDSEEKQVSSESEPESPVANTPRIPFFQSQYMNKKRGKSILVRGEEKSLGEKNLMMNLKRRVSNLFMIKPLNVIHPA